MGRCAGDHRESANPDLAAQGSTTFPRPEGASRGCGDQLLEMETERAGGVGHLTGNGTFDCREGRRE